MDNNQPTPAHTIPQPETMPCTLQDTPSPSPTDKTAMRRRSALESLSEWFWSAWTISNSETHGSLVESFDVVDNSYLFSPAVDDESPRRASSALHEECHAVANTQHVDCKACRSRGVSCDGRRPRCSHCVEQQVLCFYVTPQRRSRARSKNVHLASERAQIQALLRDGCS